MSYLNTPRICFQGKCRFAGPTRNNLLVAQDYPEIFSQTPGPDWDYFPEANSDFALLDCQVTAAWDAQGNLIVDPGTDALIGANVSGTGKMADLDPEHRRVTDLVGMYLSIALPDAGTGTQPTLEGKLEVTQLQDYWNNSSYVTVTAWQSVLHSPTWSAGTERSAILKQLHDAHADGLSVRLTPIANALPGLLLGVIGPWSQSEPRQFVAGRRLTTRRATGMLPFPVASFLVDEGRRKLVVDLSNLPMDPSTAPGASLIQGLVGSVLRDPDEGDGAWTTLGGSLDLTAGQWVGTSGIVEWDLTPVQLFLLQGHRLRLEFSFASEPLVMEEHASGCYIDVDRRSFRLNPGESAVAGVYARRLGKPLAGQVVNFSLMQQKSIAAVETILRSPTMFGYPTDPNRLMNSEPRDVLLDRPGPLQVMTNQDGFAELRITAKAGEFMLPASRKTIDSQLFFLGEPDGWQSWGAIGPNNGDLNSNRVGAGCALAVLVFNSHPPERDKPTWEDIRDWMCRYKLLYPAMSGPPVYLDLCDKDQVERDAYEIYRRLKCLHFEDVEYMPITRDLSAYRRELILAYLRSVIQGELPC